MQKTRISLEDLDVSELGIKPDAEIAKRLGVHKAAIAYWRNKLGIKSYPEKLKEERAAQFARGLQWCSKCHSYLPLSNFGVSSNEPFGLRSHCFVCRKATRDENAVQTNAKKRAIYINEGEKIRAANKRWRDLNREKLSVYMRERHIRRKAKYVELFGGKCHRCGYDEFMSGLEFHHIDGSQKDFSPVRALSLRDKEKAYAELNKCALLCRNCHMSFHASAWRAEFIKREGIGWTIQK